MAYSGTAAAWPAYVAIAAAINADGASAALLGGDKVYNLIAPTGAAFDYIVLGGINENEWYAFLSGGSEAALMLHLWCYGSDGGKAARLYGELHRALNLKTIAMDGHRLMHGTLKLIDIQPDPGGNFVHGVARFDMVALR